MKRSLTMTIVLGLFTAAFAPLAFGASNTRFQAYEGIVVLESRAAAASDSLSAQDATKEEADAYKAWYDAYSAKDLAKELDLGLAFVQKFPNSKNAAYVKADAARARGLLFNQALQAKNTSEMIRIGNDALATDPDNLDYLYLLSVGIRNNEMAGGDYTHASDLAKYSERAMRLIAADKVPNVIDKSKWIKNAVLAYFSQGLGDVEIKAKNTDKAIEQYEKAAEFDPTNAVYFLKCGSLHQEKYGVAATKYASFPEADRQAATENKPDAKPEVKAALEDANKQADLVINWFARFMGLTDGKKDFADVRTRVEKALTDLYKYRHNDSTEGLQKLIDQYKGGSSSATSKPAGSTLSS